MSRMWLGICKVRLFTITHKWVSRGEKPYKRDKCEYSSERKCIMTNHERTHAQEKSFACLKCPRIFCNKGNPAWHFKKIHGSILKRVLECEVCHIVYKSKMSYQHILRRLETWRETNLFMYYLQENIPDKFSSEKAFIGSRWR